MSISDVTLEPVSAARKMVSCSATSSSSNAQLRKVGLSFPDGRSVYSLMDLLMLKSLQTSYTCYAVNMYVSWVWKPLVYSFTPSRKTCSLVVETRLQFSGFYFLAIVK